MSQKNGCTTKILFLLLNNEMREIHEKLHRNFQNIEDVSRLCILRFSWLFNTVFTILS